MFAILSRVQNTNTNTKKSTIAGRRSVGFTLFGRTGLSGGIVCTRERGRKLECVTMWMGWRSCSAGVHGPGCVLVSETVRTVETKKKKKDNGK